MIRRAPFFASVRFARRAFVVSGDSRFSRDLLLNSSALPLSAVRYRSRPGSTGRAAQLFICAAGRPGPSQGDRLAVSPGFISVIGAP